MPKRSIFHLQKGSPHGATILLGCLILLLSSLSLHAQTSPSGQLQLLTPTTLSACNTDTIYLNLTNLQGAKGVTYAGTAKIEISIPGGALLEYINNSVSSVPAGAQQQSYTNKKLTITVPLPTTGATTRLKFVLRPDCNVGGISGLPRLTGSITYPTDFPLSSETFSSSAMNIGKTIIAHSLYDQTTYGNPTPAVSEQFRIISNILNTGYGFQNELIYTTINHKDLAFNGAFVFDANGVAAHEYYLPTTPVSTTTVGDYVYRTYRLQGVLLGGDKQFTSNETIRVDEYLIAPKDCGAYRSKRWVTYSCGTGQAVCQAPDTLYSNVKVTAGVPKVEATLVSAEDPDGCPNKKVEYKLKNTAAGNGNPAGNAYDVNLTITFGSGLLRIANVKLNGQAVPAGSVIPTSPVANTFTVQLKDKFTTDPDGAGGISDLDGDGYFDDLKTGEETTVSFDYTMPCDLACGVYLYYRLSAGATFTDYCRVLNGSTGTFLKEFGIQQVRAIEQTKQVNYGILTTGQSKIDTAKFQFQYKAFNVDVANASGELRIRYSRRMEVNVNYIRLNSVALTNAPVVQGSNTNTATDVDSMIVIKLTAAELATLFDATADRLEYEQTYYGCDIRQNTTSDDSWQLLLQLKADTCSDGSTPCSFDLACRKPFVYGSGQACGPGKPCYVSDVNIIREKPIGWTDVSQTTPKVPIDSTRSYAGDTVMIKASAFINGLVNMEPHGYWTAQGQAHQELRMGFSLAYKVPKGWMQPISPFYFLEKYSEVVVRQRTPGSNANQAGTLGAVLFTAPLLEEDFFYHTWNTVIPVQNNYPSNFVSENGQIYGAVWYCNNAPNTWHVKGLCPIEDGYYSYNVANGANISDSRRRNMAQDKVRDLYYLSIGKALGRAGWTANPGDPQYYYEVRLRWRLNPDFPWDNSNDWDVFSFWQHYGNVATVPEDSPASTTNTQCNQVGATHLTTAKSHTIANPKAVYSADCGLKVSHKVFFKSNEGDYFRDGEVRVPLKIDSVIVKLPTPYTITAGTIGLAYHQNCTTQNTTAITASATTGQVRFSATGGGDFPRADDCSGNHIAYDLTYTLAKTGSAAPTQYKVPVKIYSRDEFNNVIILTDTITIAEAKPELILSPLTPILTNTDGGSCQPAFFDFELENKTLYDAPNVYLAAESSTGTQILSIVDTPGQSLVDPITASDTSAYGSAHLLARLGTLPSGGSRRIRVYAQTNLCTDQFKVYADFGCSYPAQPNKSSATIEEVTAQYVAQSPILLSKPNALNITNLCDTNTVEIEVTNANLANVYQLKLSTKLPQGVQLVASSVKYKHPTTATAFSSVPTGNIQAAGDSVVMDLSNVAPFSTACGLTGADTTTKNRLIIQYKIVFTACPTASEIPYALQGTNYCGTLTRAMGVVPLNLVGTAGTQNNYSLSSVLIPLQVCAAKNGTQSVSDQLYIKNLGGYGSASGASSGQDSVTLTLAVDHTLLQVSNVVFAAPFANPVVGTDPQGHPTYRVLIPAGLAVGDSLAVSINYTITPKVDNVCLKDQQPALCFFGLFSSPVLLSCPAKNINCGAVTRHLRGSGVSIRDLVCCYGSIGDYVWVDTNNDGQQGSTAAEPPVAGVKVYLLNASGAKIDSTVTDAQGKYLFDSLLAGSYRVQFTAPAGSKPTTANTGADVSDSDAGKNGITHLITIDVSKAESDTLRNNPQIDAGFVPFGSLGDYVWFDNGDNVQGSGDTPASGVKVYLLDAAGTKIDSTVTNAQGKYLFDSLVAGTYSVQFVVPAGQSVVTPNTGSDDEKDSDAGVDGKTGTYTIDTTKPLGDPARNITSVDAGLKANLGSIGDYVWVDANSNGQQDSGELPVAGVKVYLLNASGAKIDSTVTDAQGKYLFDGLVAGSYRVQFVAPAGSKLTNANVGNDDSDSDANTSTGQTGLYTINTNLPSGDPGRDNRSVDAGIVPFGSLGDYVWFDNGDNVQGSGDTPTSGIKVYLLDASGAKIDSTVTNAQGKYLFDSLVAGTYSVQFVVPAGQSVVTPNTGSDDEKDSDAGVDGKTGTYTIDTTKPLGDPARNITSVDAGLKANLGSIGDYVWVDTNNDGQQGSTATEPPVVGVKVYLLNASGVKIDSTVTDAQGKYLFDGLVAGSYRVQFVAPAGSKLTNANVGNDDSDSDANTSTGQTGLYTINTNLPSGDPGRDNRSVDAGIVPFGSLGDYVWFDNGDNVQGSGDTPASGVKVYLLNAAGTKIDSTVTNAQGKYLFDSLVAGTYSVQFVVPAGQSVVTPNTGSDDEKDSDAGVDGKTGTYTIDTTKPLGDPARNITSVDAGLKTICPILTVPVTTFDVCQGESFPTLQATVTSAVAGVAWYNNAAGTGTPLATTTSFTPSGVVNSATTFYVRLRHVPVGCDSSLHAVTVSAKTCIDTVDLALSKRIDKKIAQVGDELTYTIKVWNESNKNATGVEVTDSLNVGVSYVSSTASRGSYNPTTKIWTIGNIAANGDTVTLQIKVKVLAEGIWFNTAEISKTNEKDKDSTPNNSKEDEDDLDRECFTVPFKLCTGQSVQVVVPAKYTNVVWSDGQTGNVVLFNKAGSYTFTANNGGCPSGGCCPVIVTEVDCCPPTICVPFTIKKVKKN